ncbi:MAG: DGC domain protein [Methanomassiliicoccales archaeon PtaU1.Bin124]|nr:MAG: DGC domain protein [Methanomassiliicoccales archaeon PtaU1.Bin124]
MRVSVIVCGANGERSVIIEKAVEEFAKGYFDKIIQFSACTVIGSPMIVEMSGGKADRTVAVNGCRNKCADRILKNANIEPKISLVLDDIVPRKLQNCEGCTKFVFPDITEEECHALAQRMGQAVDQLK